MLDFHRQVSNVVAHVSDQYKELFGTGCNLSEDCSQEQMKAQLMGALNVSGRYFAFKEQMKVRTTSHIPEEWIKLAGTLKVLEMQPLAHQIFLLVLLAYMCVFLMSSMQL